MSAAGSVPQHPDDSDSASRSISTGPPRLTVLREMQLVDAHRAGEAEAAAELIAAYQRRIYGVCYRMVHHAEDARDLSQDAIVKVLEGLGSYDGRSKLSTWIIRVTMNCCLSHLRKAKLRRHSSLDEQAAGGSGGETGSRHSGPGADPWAGVGAGHGTGIGPGAGSGSSSGGGGGGGGGRGELSAPQRVERDEMRALLLKAMARLEPDMRAVLVLRDLQELDYQQVSEVIGVPVGTVKSRLFRARAALRKEIESMEKS